MSATQHLQQAAALAAKGQLPEAATEATRALELDPSLVGGRLILGVAAIERGDLPVAIESLKIYTQSQANDPQGWFHLGLAFQRDEQWRNALRAYRRTIELAPALVPAHLNLAETLVRQGRIDDALHAIDRLKSQPLAPDQQARASRLQADLHRRAGRLDRCLAVLKEHIADHPNDALALDTLGVLTAAIAPSEAKDYARRAARLAPDHPGIQFNLAALLSRDTDPETLRVGESAARRALAVAPRHAAAWNCLGLILDKLDRADDARRSLATAVEIAPDNTRLRVQLGDHLMRRGAIGEALRVLSGAVGLDPNSAEANRQLGIALLKDQRPDEARTALSRAYAMDPSDQRTIAHLGLARQLTGADREADFLGLKRHIRSIDIAPPAPFSTTASFNQALAQDIRNHSTMRWEPIGLAARGGGLTEELLTDRTPAITGFAARLREAVDALIADSRKDADDPFLLQLPTSDYQLNLWATLVRRDGSIDTHIHEESWLSGAYYVTLPRLGDEADPQGWIEFGRPHAGLGEPGPEHLRLLEPAVGRLFLFPSYLFHRTLPFDSDEERISISFDLIAPARTT